MFFFRPKTGDLPKKKGLRRKLGVDQKQGVFFLLHHYSRGIAVFDRILYVFFLSSTSAQISMEDAQSRWGTRPSYNSSTGCSINAMIYIEGILCFLLDDFWRVLGIRATFLHRVRAQQCTAPWDQRGELRARVPVHAAHDSPQQVACPFPQCFLVTILAEIGEQSYILIVFHQTRRAAFTWDDVWWSRWNPQLRLLVSKTQRHFKAKDTVRTRQACWSSSVCRKELRARAAGAQTSFRLFSA